MSHRKAAKKAEEPCEIHGCTVAGPPPTTCVTWGHRLCYPHFAGYYSWSEHTVVNRAPTPEEWKAFETWIVKPNERKTP